MNAIKILTAAAALTLTAGAAQADHSLGEEAEQVCVLDAFETNPSLNYSAAEAQLAIEHCKRQAASSTPAQQKSYICRVSQGKSSYCEVNLPKIH
jgi:hypothetical protein